MFAILISQDNLDKMLSRVTPTEDKHPDFDIFIRNKNDWYLITKLVTSNGKLIDWAILPEYMLKDFEYDPDKIQTDWDQIVRL